MKVILLIALAFLLGSIPFGAVIARIQGINLKEVGSGNVGATNVMRAMGKGPALFTLAGDVIKGVLPVLIGRYLVNDFFWEGVIGLSAISGHIFSPFLGFRGGKGVATSIGVMLVYSPIVGLITVIIWLAFVLITRYSSMGALISFGSLPLNIYVFDYSQEKLIISVAVSALLIIRHISNIKRLIEGTETRIGVRSDR